MYTDTKNLAQQLTEMSLTTSPPNTTADKPKRKLCKMWRPLLRLMARKCNKTQAGSSAHVVSLHPNNVHLNNSARAKCETSSTSVDSVDSAQWPTTLIEDYTSLMRKMSCKEECNHGAWEASATSAATPDAERPCQASAKFATTIISSASIEKTPPSTCAHCVYGRNCQHEQFHHHVCEAVTAQHATSTSAPAATATTPATTPATTAPYLPAMTDSGMPAHNAIAPLLDLPIQLVHTDDGTFFWTNAEDKIDDDLLTAWLCESWRQLPVEAALL